VGSFVVTAAATNQLGYRGEASGSGRGFGAGLGLDRRDDGGVTGGPQAIEHMFEYVTPV
jgi:hypothetical protein